MLVTKKDLATLSGALIEHLPDIVFLPRLNFYRLSLKKKPSSKTYPSIQECPGSYVDMYLRRDGWKPKYIWEQEEDYDGSPSGRWGLDNPPAPMFEFQGNIGVRTYAGGEGPTPPHLGISSFVMAYNMYEPDQMQIRAKVNRILSKVLSSKLRRVDYPSLRELPKPSYSLWAGPDAIRWCRADSSRVIHFNRSVGTGECWAWLPA